MASIIELANVVAENTKIFSDYVSAHNITVPTFDADSPVSWNIPSGAEDIVAARKAALGAIRQLEESLLGPRDYFKKLIQVAQNVPIQAVTRFNIARTIPLDKEVAIADLASQAHVKIRQPELERLLRYAIALRIFEYGEQPNHIRHTAVSRLLAENTDLHDWAGAACEDMWGSAAQVVNALVKYPGSQEPNETGFNLAEHTDLSLYQFFEQHPRRAKQFSNAMDSISKGNPGLGMDHVVNGYAWNQLHHGLVVDVGGSGGQAAYALAEAFPELQCIVQDLPAVVKDIVVPPKFVGRVSFMAHDFFEPQPVKHADVYFLRWILHNWPDKYAIRILQNLASAMKVGSKVLICDDLMPPHGALPEEMELALCHLDINMLSIQNAKLRSAKDWETLISQADPRFVFKGISRPPGSILAFVEAEWGANPQA